MRHSGRPCQIHVCEIFLLGMLLVLELGSWVLGVSYGRCYTDGRAGMRGDLILDLFVLLVCSLFFCFH
jgi:hypothetical protein